MAQIEVNNTKVVKQEQWVIEGSLYVDREAKMKILTPIGTFDTREEADDFMWKMRPYFGSYDVVPLYTPLESASHVNRAAAANLIEARKNVQKNFTERLADLTKELEFLMDNSSDSFQKEITDQIIEILTEHEE